MTNKECVCGKTILSNHFKRHQKSCKEYYAYVKTCELKKDLVEKSSTSETNVQNLQIQLREKELQIERQKTQLEEKDIQIKEKDDQIKDKDKQIQKLENALIQKPTYKNCQMNTINVTVNAWGNETFDHITEEDKVRALRNYMTAIPNIVEQIHFGNEKKNRNVKLPNKRGREVLIHKELENGEVKQVHEDLNEVLEDMIANGKYVLDPVADRMNLTKYKKFREDLRESERVRGKLYAEQKSAVKRKLMDNACEHE